MWRVLVLFVWGLLWACCRAQDPIHLRYTTAHGLPSNLIYCAFQDRDGFLWFGTEVGVSRFDGHSFMNLSVEDGLSDNNVLVIEQDSKGRIWFLTLNGRLSYWKDGQVYNGTTVPDLARYHSPHGLQTFAEDKDGLLWFGAIREDVVRIDLEADRDSVLRCPTGHVDMIPGASGAVLMSWVDSLYRFENDTWTPICRVHPFGIQAPKPKYGITATSIVYHGPARGVSAIISDGVRFYELDTFGVVPLHMDPAILGTGHTGCWRDRGGNLWARKAEGGAYRWSMIGSGVFGTAELLFPDDRINFVTQDVEGNLWIATRGDGVVLVLASDIGSHQHGFSLGRPVSVSALHTNQRGRLLIGTTDGRVFALEPGQRVPHLFNHPEPPCGRIRAFAELPDGGTLVATDRDLLRLSDRPLGTVSTYGALLNDHGVQHLGSKTVVVGPSGRIWAPFMGMHFLLDARPAAIRSPLPLGEFNEARIYAVQEDAQGDLWFGAGAELVRWSKGSATRINRLNERFGLRITAMQWLKGDTLLVATTGKGVQLLRRGVAIDEWTTEHGLLSNDVRAIRVSGDSVLVCSPQGVTLAVHQRGTMRVLRTWSAGAGLPVAEVNEALLSRGRLYVGTTQGLCELDPAKANTEPQPPVMYFARVEVNDSAIGLPQSTLALEQGKDRLSISFSTINYVLPDRDEYQYRLDPASNWVVSRTGSLDLSDMEPGAYRLEARGRRSGSDWSEPIHLAFEVVPPWWNRSWVRVALWLGVSAALLLAVRWRLRKRYERTLESMRQRQALDEERRRIAADVHDDLGADLSRVLMHARATEHAGAASVSSGIEASIRKIDEIVWSLDPGKDTLRSTAEFIERLARDHAEAAGLSFRTTLDLPVDDTPLPAAMRRDVVLIAREAMRNVVKHAEATGLQVDWSQQPGWAILSIVDDGKGIGPSPANGRHGQANMQARAERIGAELHIGPGDHGGTRVRLAIPVPLNHPNG